MQAAVLHEARPAVRGFPAAENAFIAALFALTVLVPLAEIALRATLRIGIDGVGTIVQHLTLALGMFGAAAAARDERLLALAFSGFLRGAAARAGRFAGRAVAGTVAALLTLATLDFISAERASGSRLVYGVPVWTIELPLLAGYALITARLLLRAADSVRGRLAAIVLAAAVVAWLRLAPPDPAAIALPAVAVLVAAAFAGAPLFALIGGAALFLLVGRGVPAAAVAGAPSGAAPAASLRASPIQLSGRHTRRFVIANTTSVCRQPPASLR